MERAEVEENGETVTLMIHRIHEPGPEAARHFLSAERHEIVISEFVERRLDQFQISRQMQEPSLILGVLLPERHYLLRPSRLNQI